MQFERWSRLILTCLPLIVPGQAAELRITISDQTGQPIWARLEVRGPEGKTFQPGEAIVVHSRPQQPADLNYIGSFVVKGKATVPVPPGRYMVVAEHGLEYNRVETPVEVAADRPYAVAIQLRPWIRMNDRGWYSGDMHVHRAPEDAPALILAEDLNICVNFTMWNKRNLWEDRALRAEPVVRVDPVRFVTLMNAEDERGGGAWMLHNLKKPLARLEVDGRWYPPGISFVREAREQKAAPDDLFPWFDSEKPIWWETPVLMALATPDSLGVVHNHFDQYTTLANEAWGRPRDRQKYPGPEGFMHYSLELYYRYLNLGFRVPPSAGAASGVLPNPVGHNRMYAPVSGPLTVEKWYSAVRDGKVLVTNGPILFFNLSSAGSKWNASIEAHAREPIDRIELVANGEVLQALKPNPGALDYTSAVTLDLARHSWIAARCFLRNEGSIRFGHTSPIYLSGEWDSSSDALYFVNWMDQLIAQTEADLNRFNSDSEKTEVLSLYRQARDFYAGKARR